MNIKNVVKEMIASSLKTMDEDLTQNDIKDKSLELFNNLLNPVIFPILKSVNSKLTSVEDIKKLNVEEIIKELETIFNVKVEKGISLVDFDETRDATWWTGIEKQQNELFYWERYKRYMNENLSPRIVNVLDEDTDVVMNHIENPEIERFNRLGMVIGHVQSGKTGNFTGLICKAADAGYKFIIVIAGGLKILRKQTQERLNIGFIGANSLGVKIGVGLDITNNDVTKRPITLTIEEDDFNKKDVRKAISLNDTQKPMVMVIKKNSSVLKNVIKWLESDFKNEVDYPMIVIDDESDYGSINTKGQENPTAINKSIRKILSLFNKSAYVAYTATPYANIFIDHSIEDDLFPKDFIHCLDAPSNYFGAAKIFKVDENENRKHVEEIDDNEVYIPLKHKKDYDVKQLPESLKEAIRVFILNIAIRELRGDGSKHNSMLVHVSNFTNMHEGVKYQISTYFENLKNSLNSFGLKKNGEEQDKNIKSIRETFNKFYSNEINEKYLDVKESLVKKLKTILIRDAHQRTKLPLEYRNDIATNVIVIGGMSLSRGFTLEGLSVSYFLRRTMYYDTLMQMGRWFGYRDNYEDLCKIYMTSNMADNFGHIINATEELIGTLKEMHEKKKTPREFGIAIKTHPESALQITAKNKQKNATEVIVDMSFNNTLKQTTWLSKNVEDIANNYKIIEELIRNNELKIENSKNNYILKDVNKSEIINFLESFKVFDRNKDDNSFGLLTHLPIKFMIKDLEENDRNFDVVFSSGEGNKVDYFYSHLQKLSCIKRTLLKTEDDCYRLKMLSSISTESLALPEYKREKLKNVITSKGVSGLQSRTEIRKHLERPVLFINFVESKKNSNIQFPAYGVIYPNQGGSGIKKVSLKVNTVFLANLKLEEEFENEE